MIKLCMCFLFFRKKPLTAQQVLDMVKQEPYQRRRFNCPLCATSVVHLKRHLRKAHNLDSYRKYFPSMIAERRKDFKRKHKMVNAWRF